ncbi:hypothetical protein [Streptomyces sp. NPDC008139]|uniref:hypothetical protein n=1 Tax=Streptomyces sp. NPDC008139 TaxID=3364814 RepID=UPI0036E8FCF1
MAFAVREGGAAGMRAQGLDDLRVIRAVTDVPLIGLWKDGTRGGRRDGAVRTPGGRRHRVGRAGARPGGGQFVARVGR